MWGFFSKNLSSFPLNWSGFFSSALSKVADLEVMFCLPVQIHLSSLILTRVLKCILESGANSGSGWLGGPGQTGTRRACNEVGSGNATEWSRNDLRLQNRGIVPVYSKSPSISHCQDLSAPVNQLFKCSSSYVSFCNVGVKGCFFCPVRTT